MAKLTRVDWSDVRDYLRPAYEDDLEAVDAMASEGRAVAYSLNDGDAYMLCRVDVEADGSTELVIVAARGRGLRESLPDILDRAQKAGNCRVRFHTKKAGVGRGAEKHGFRLKEYIYTVDLDNGHQQQEQN